MIGIHTTDAPKPVGPYSQAVVAGGVVYCSGQIGLNPSTSSLVSGGIEEQTEQIFHNLSAVLKASESDLRHVLRTTVMMQNIADFPIMNKIYEKLFSEAKGSDFPMPARTVLQVAALPLNALITIDCIALQSRRYRQNAESKHASETSSMRPSAELKQEKLNM